MSEVAIRVSGLSKAYAIYAQPSDRLRQFVWPRLQRLLGRPATQYHRDFWALRDASFEVKRGQTVGIIGRNGSGKSTLLQMICGTLSPSLGEVQINGRVAALLELGSGFNPEFTGRENVYLNATVLGLSQALIEQRFEAIVQFADIGDFLEQPVKTYSSGMLVRLAFAVIAHVDADILVIDEALAVGDAVFTQKCMRFLRSFMKNGTVLFVSHDTGSVSNLCDSVVWLNQGRVQEIGSTPEVLKAYSLFVQQEILGDLQKFEAIEQAPPEATNELSSAAATPDVATKLAFFEQINESSGWKTQLAEITAARLLLHSGEVAAQFQGGERVRLDIEALCHSPITSPILGWFLKDRLGQPLFGEHTYTYTEPLACVAGERLRASFVFRLPLLPNGSYTMTVSIADGDPWNHTQHHWLHEAFVVQVNSTVLRHGLVGIPFEQVTMEKFE